MVGDDGRAVEPGRAREGELLLDLLAGGQHGEVASEQPRIVEVARLQRAVVATGADSGGARAHAAEPEAAARAAQKKDFTYQGKGSEGLAKAEQEAKKRLSSKPSQADVEACLKLLGDSWPTQERPNVTPDGKAVRSRRPVV